MSATAPAPASHPRLDRLVAQAIARAGNTPGALAMVYPCDALAMDAAARILDSGMARPVLIGPAELIAQAAAQAGVDVRRFEVVDTGAHAPDAALRATTLARSGGVSALMKGSLHTDELMSAYHAAEAASGVAWNYLAAINFVETRFGSIVGLSTAGAQGPMQFLPSTFAPYGQGGDIDSPRDSIMAAGRFLAANGFASDRDHAVYQYNHAHQYVQAVGDYAALMASDPAVFADYYRWDVYYLTTAGDVLLPMGYAESSRIPVGEYLASHPQ